MTNSNPTSLAAPAFLGGTKAITLTPVVGTPRRQYAEMFIPGEEQLEDGEMRVTVLGSGNPWVTRGQASASVLVEVGNAERDLLVFDLGSGCLANYASLKLPVNKLNKVFLTHLHADHMGDLITLSGSWSKVGRADGPVYVWGPSGTEPRFGHAALRQSDRGSPCLGHRRRGRRHQPGEHEDRSVRIRLQPDPGGPRGERRQGDIVSRRPRAERRRRLPPRFRRPVVRLSGDARACWPLVRACEGVDLLIHECFPPAAALAAASGLSIERATLALNAAHTSPKAAGKVFGLVKPRVAGLWHTLLAPQVISLLFSELSQVYDGPIVQTQDLTVFNVTKEAVVARQAQVMPQLPPIPGVQRAAFKPVAVPPPDWWAEALIPLD